MEPTTDPTMEPTMDLGRVGVWSMGLRAEDPAGRAAAVEAAAELEELGYGTLWLGGSPGVQHAEPLLAGTSRVVVATGILSIWDYEPADVAGRHAALAAVHPGRFLLGLGVSHEFLAPERYRRPLTAMRTYLDGLDAAPTPVPAAQRVLAALGPRMLETARDRAAGAHPYMVTPEHTRRAREILGPDRLLAPEVKVVLEPDPDKAYDIAHGHVAFYVAAPNYANSLRRLGYSEDDMRDGGTPELVREFVTWGDLEKVRNRVAAHFDAGADHVCVQVVTEHREGLPRQEWRHVAAALDLKA